MITEVNGIGKNNYIHPTAIVGSEVTLGTENYIGPYCNITGKTIIGNNNRFESYCSVGSPAESIGYFDSNNGITTIGNNNIFREFITINAGTTKTTTLKNNIVMLRNSHVGHDCVLEDNVKLLCNVLIGGYSYLMEGANFGLGSICHQLVKIGAYSMIGMGTIITKTTPIKPGGVYVGSPAKYLKSNEFGFKRYNVTEQDIILFNERYNNIVVTR